MSASIDVDSGISALSLDTPTFKYNALESTEEEIRLLQVLPRSDGFLDTLSDKIRCGFLHTRLRTARPYKALSYTWGSPDDPQFTILLNRQNFRVRKNLWLALQQFTVSEQAEYWIDAIAINQCDDQERNKQVTLMKDIYERAEEVVVWLGPADEDSDLAMKLIQDLYNCQSSEGLIYTRLQDPMAKREVKAVLDLIDRPYWERMWIAQELAVAKRITILCGSRRIKAEALEVVHAIFSEKHTESRMIPIDFLRSLLPVPHLPYRAAFLLNGIASIRNWQKSFASQNLTYYECLLYHCERQCTDQRDRVYGLSALANSRSHYHITVDYSLSVAEVYIDLAKKEIQQGRDLVILTRAFDHVGSYALPSWVPDLSASRNGHGHLREVLQSDYYFSAAGTSTKEVILRGTTSLHLKAVVLGVVEAVGVKSGMRSVNDIENALQAFLAWWSLLPKTGNQVQGFQDRFGMTLICHFITAEKLKLWSKIRFSRYVLALYSELCREQYSLDVIDSMIAEYTLLEYGLRGDGRSDGETFDMYKRRPTDLSWFQGSCYFIWDRRFFLGPSEMMGMAPEEVIEDDIICIPFGCPHPMIFRKVEAHYIVIGEAYVDGHMYGEAMEMLERGKLKAETFELH